MEKDKIFNYEQTITDFAFDERTVNVFPDMIHRSIPAYASLVQMSSLIAANIFKKQTNLLVYDLGCSLGAVSLAFKRLCPEAKIIAVDKSAAMIKKFSQFLKTENKEIDLIEADINDFPLKPCSIIFLNFVLQFIEIEKRDLILKNIFNNLEKGGVLILAEKTFNNQELKIWHEDFKRYQGYSDLEIAQKREALENVMKTEEIITIEQRLTNCGFLKIIPFYQAFAFKAWAVIK